MPMPMPMPTPMPTPTTRPTAYGASMSMVEGVEHQQGSSSSSSHAARKKKSAVVGIGILGIGTLAVGLFASRRDDVGSRLSGSQTAWKPCDGCPLQAEGPGGGSSQTTFTLRSQCKTAEVKSRYPDFFVSGTNEAYVVKHNYGSHNFFKEEDAVRMNRVKLSDSEYGYRVATSDVNFEFGFAFKNAVTEDWLWEIGKDDSLLAAKNCTQKYGSYFNRVRTLEENPSQITYLFGSCEHECPADYVDGSYDFQKSSETAPIPTCSAGQVDLGEGDDARLFTLYSALMLKNGNAHVRSPTSRDTTYSESKERARWLVHIIEQDDKSIIKVAALDVSLVGDRIKGCVSASKQIALGSECTAIDCSSAYHDVVGRFSQATTYNTLGLHRLHYTIARVGDPRPEGGSHIFTNDAFLSTYTIAQAGTWGEDIDARRLILITGSPCGVSVTRSGCTGAYTATPFTDFTPTANEKQWILGSIMGRPWYKMVRVRVFVDGGALKIQTMAARWADPGSVSGQYDFDPMRDGFNVMAAWNNPAGSLNVASRNSADGYGVSTLKWSLAPEMSPSLASA